MTWFWENMTGPGGHRKPPLTWLFLTIILKFIFGLLIISAGNPLKENSTLKNFYLKNFQLWFFSDFENFPILKNFPTLKLIHFENVFTLNIFCLKFFDYENFSALENYQLFFDSENFSTLNIFQPWKFFTLKFFWLWKFFINIFSLGKFSAQNFSAWENFQLVENLKFWRKKLLKF